MQPVQKSVKARCLLHSVNSLSLSLPPSLPHLFLSPRFHTGLNLLLSSKEGCGHYRADDKRYLGKREEQSAWTRAEEDSRVKDPEKGIHTNTTILPHCQSPPLEIDLEN